MPRSVPIADVKAHFADWVRAAESGDGVVITRHGKPVAGLVPAAAIERLARLEAAGPEKGLAGLAGGWQGSEELIERTAADRRTRPRKAPRPR